MVRAVHFLALAALLALVGAPPPPLIVNAAVKGSAAAGGPPPAPCSAAPDCATAQYCDNRNECYDCTFLAYGKCDAIDEDCCSAAFLKQCPNDPMKASCQEARCTAALETECGANKSNVFDCANCAVHNEQKLHSAGCNNNDISVWCGGGAPTPGESPYFSGSEILDSEMGVSLNGLTGFGPTQNWTMCYSSFTNDSKTAAVFHQLCDRHDNTLSVVINHIDGVPRVFGGWVRILSPSLPSVWPSLRCRRWGCLCIGGLVEPDHVLRQKSAKEL